MVVTVCETIKPYKRTIDKRPEIKHETKLLTLVYLVYYNVEIRVKILDEISELTSFLSRQKPYRT